MLKTDAFPLRVLIVDDDAEAATTFNFLLQHLGCTTAVAYGPATGLRIAALFRPDIVFVDFEMPGMNGCQFLERLRVSEEGQSAAYKVCVTGNPTAASSQAAESCFDELLAKPMNPELLFGLLSVQRARLGRCEIEASSLATSSDQRTELQNR